MGRSPPRGGGGFCLLCLGVSFKVKIRLEDKVAKIAVRQQILRYLVLTFTTKNGLKNKELFRTCFCLDAFATSLKKNKIKVRD